MNPKNSNVVDLNAFREQKSLQESIARGRVPLYSTHLNSKPHLGANQDDFGARMQRIKDSLERINHLMAELRKQSPEFQN